MWIVYELNTHTGRREMYAAFADDARAEREAQALNKLAGMGRYCYFVAGEEMWGDAE
jgi:hypothetical protein